MAVKPNSLKNLKPTKKGQVLNPKGRGKGALNSKTIINKWLNVIDKGVNPISKQMEKMTVLDRVTLSQIAKALKGDTSAFNALLDRAEGKAVQKIEEDVTLKEFKVGYGVEKPV